MALTNQGNIFMYNGITILEFKEIKDPTNPWFIEPEIVNEYKRKVLEIDMNEKRLECYKAALIVFYEAYPQYKEKIDKLLSI